jgi:ABC-type transport system substrate-binding protein
MILVASMFTVIPATAFIHPDGTTDNNSELFGPHVDQMIFQMYATQDAMWQQMNLGAIDLCDWPLTTAWRVTLAGNPDVNVVSAGGEVGFFTIDFNMDPYPFVPNSARAPYANPVYTNASGGYSTGIPPISSNMNFRLACLKLFNRTMFTQAVGAAGVSILTPVPSYMGGYIWPAPPPAPAPNYASAEAELNAGGIYQTNAGVRYWDYDGSGTTNNPPQTEIDACKLVFTYRLGEYRQTAGIMLSNELGNMNFTFKYLAMLNGGQNYQRALLDKDYHITTLGWIYIGPDPDYLYDLYHVTSFWDDPESSCPNTADLNDTILNGYAEDIKFAVTQPDAVTAAWAFQQRFWAICAQIPLYSSARYGASSKYYTGGNDGVKLATDDGENQFRLKNQSDPTSRREWLGFCNQAGFGSNNWFSYLNGYPNCTIYSPAGYGNNMTLRYGWSEQGYPKHINPFYSEWYWDSMVLGAMYDSLGYRDPYDMSTWKSDLIKNWTVGSWTDPVTMEDKSKVTITLRPDIYWNDGTPMTIADVVFSLVESTPLLIAYGYAPPWWWPTAELVKSLSIIDPYTVEILYDIASFFAEVWTLGGFYIVPKHIWQPLIISGANMAAFAPDPNFVASGPWRYKSYAPYTNIVMVANTPGSNITTDMTAHGASAGPGLGQVHPVYSPRGYHNYNPIYVDIRTDDYKTNIALLNRLQNTTKVNVTVTLLNRWTNNGDGGVLNVSKYVYIDGNLIAGPADSVLATLTPDVEQFSLNLSAGAHTVRVDVNVTGPNPIDTLGHANPWSGRNITSTLQLYVSACEVKVDPTTTSVPIGQTFDVNITVTNATDLYLWVFSIRWNPATLEFMSMTEGDFLSRGGSTTGILIQSVNQTMGYLKEAACSLLGNLPGVNGTGNLATITFKSKAPGLSLLDIYFHDLMNSTGSSIPSYATNGDVTVEKTADLSILDISLPYPTLPKYVNITVPINVTIQNTGTGAAGTFNVSFTAYWNDGALLEHYEEQEIAGLPAGTNTMLSFSFMPRNVGNYTLTFMADSADEIIESNETNNQMTLPVVVRVQGDMTGDSQVTYQDLYILARAYWSTSADSNWDPRADINCDGTVNHLDLFLLSKNYS